MGPACHVDTSTKRCTRPFATLVVALHASRVSGLRRRSHGDTPRTAVQTERPRSAHASKARRRLCVLIEVRTHRLTVMCWSHQQLGWRAGVPRSLHDQIAINTLGLPFKPALHVHRGAVVLVVFIDALAGAARNSTSPHRACLLHSHLYPKCSGVYRHVARLGRMCATCLRGQKA